jgi:tetratricopeptide (TPR) repeat protein
VIGLVQVGEQAHADRYTYLPQIGLYVMIAWTVGDLSFNSTRLGRAVVALTAGLAILALSARAFDQTSFWKNSETLWNHALAVTGENDVAHNNLGFLFLRRGELDKASAEFQMALEIRSKNTQSHYGLGMALIQSNLGNVLARQQLYDAAVDHLQEAVKLRPDYADAHFNLGSVLFQQGKIEQAITQWRKAIELRPRDAEAHRNVADALFKQRKMHEAISEYKQALNITPEDPAALNNLASILATCPDASIRDGTQAITFASRAVQVSGGKNPSLMRTLAAAQAEAGQFVEAAATAETAKSLAEAQGKAKLAKELEEEIMLYRAGLTVRE